MCEYNFVLGVCCVNVVCEYFLFMGVVGVCLCIVSYGKECLIEICLVEVCY